MNLGPIWQVSENHARKLCFLYFYAFRRSSQLGWTNLFVSLKQASKVMIGKEICPQICKCEDFEFQSQYRAEIGKEIALKFASVKISNFNHSTGLIYHDQMDILELGTGINKYFDDNFHFMKHFGQSLGWPLLQVTKSLRRPANKRSELFWPSFPIP